MGYLGGGVSVWIWRWKVGYVEEFFFKFSWVLGFYLREYLFSRVYLRVGENTIFRYSLFLCKFYFR